MFEKLLVAIDGSDLSNKALDAALDLAKTRGSQVTVLTATDPVNTVLGSGGFGTMNAATMLERLDEAYRDEAAKVLQAAKTRASEAGVEIDTVYVPRQRAADAIVQEAETRGCDTILMGSHGNRGLRKLILGSQAAEVLARSTVPVLILK